MESVTPKAPLLVRRNQPLGVGNLTNQELIRYTYYFWFFGWTAKLPFTIERMLHEELPPEFFYDQFGELTNPYRFAMSVLEEARHEETTAQSVPVFVAIKTGG
jgi:hypothetical protein